MSVQPSSCAPGHAPQLPPVTPLPLPWKLMSPSAEDSPPQGCQPPRSGMWPTTERSGAPRSVLGDGPRGGQLLLARPVSTCGRQRACFRIPCKDGGGGAGADPLSPHREPVTAVKTPQSLQLRDPGARGGRSCNKGQQTAGARGPCGSWVPPCPKLSANPDV